LANQEVNNTDVKRVQQRDINGVVRFSHRPKAGHKICRRRLLNLCELPELGGRMSKELPLVFQAVRWAGCVSAWKN
jgi:hypothetical protein